MAALAQAFVEVRPQTDRFPGELKRQIGKVDGKRIGDQVGTRIGVGMHGAIASAVSRSAKLFVVGFAAIQGAKVFSRFIADAQESARVSRLTANVIRSTGGAAKISAGQVDALAQSISNKTGVDDEAVQTGANLLLTFKNIKREGSGLNDVFGRATAAAIDLSAAGFGDINGASKALGKALNDPLKGITALGRAGVTFTAKQKEQIAALVKTGDVLSAQKIILKEVESQVGGAAAAAADPIAKLRTILGNVGEDIGTLVLPAISKFATFVGARLVPGIYAAAQLLKGGFTEGLQGNTGFAGVLERIGDVAHRVVAFVTGTVLPGFRALFSAFKDPDITSDGFAGVMEHIGVVLRRVVDFISGTVIPAITRFAQVAGPVLVAVFQAVAGFLQGRVIPAFKAFGGFIVDTVIPAAQKLWAFLAQNLGPTFTALGNFIVQRVWPALQGLWVRFQQVAPAIGAFIGFLAKLVGGLVAVVVVILGKVLPVIINLAGPIFTLVIAAVGKVIGIFAALVNFIRTVLGPAVVWLWNNVFVPAFNGIKAVIGVVWPIVRGIFQTWVAFIRNVLAPIVMWIWRNVVAPAFEGIQRKIAAVWAVVRPILAAFGGFIRDKVAPAFSAGVTAIGRAWDRVKAIATTPINFIIGTVLNRGIFAAYNWIVRKFGGTQIPNLRLIGQGSDVAPQSRSRNGSAAGLARGGTVPFVTNGPRAIVGEGNPRWPEYVIPTDPQHRRRALSLYEDLGAQMLDDGGVIGAGFRAGLKRAAGIVTANADNDPTKWLQQKISAALGVAGQSPFARLAMAIPRKIGQILLAKAKGLFGGGTFAPGLRGVVDFARSQVGALYAWGRQGPKSIGYDCSGFVSNLVEVAKGLPLYRRLFATGSMGGYPWNNHFNGAFKVGWTTNAGSGIGHTAATVNGVNMESRGGDGVVVGSRSRGANQSIFNRHAFLAEGGIVPWGSVSPQRWQQLLAAGWRGRAGDRREALYRPVRSWVTGGDGSRAKMLRSHINHGGRFFEDFSYRGASPFYRRGNDRLAAHFWAGHRGFNFGGPRTRPVVGSWLNNVITQAIYGIRQRRLARGGIIPGDPPFDVLDRRGKYYQPGLLDALKEAKVADRGGWLAPNSTTMVRNGTSEWEPVGPPGPQRLHPADIQALGEVIGRVVVGGIRSNDVAVGRTADLILRGG